MRDSAPRSCSALFAALLCLSPAAPAQSQTLPRGAPGGAFVLHHGSRCLDVNEPQWRTDGARVQLWECLGRPSQAWRFEAGRIVNLETGRCLDVHAPDAGGNGARVQVSNCHGGANQSWRIDQGRLIVQVDGRCLDVHGPDVDSNAAHVQTWDCRGGPRQQWGIEPAGAPPPARDVEAGPIWNNADADQKCPTVCAPSRWTGHWRTTVPGRMSVCNCGIDDAPPPGRAGAAPHTGDSHGPGRAPRPMSDARFEALLAAMAAESFASGQLRVLEDASRDNHFVVAQLQRVIERMPFPGDRMRAVEIMGPRILDPQNAFRLYAAFSFDSEKEQVRAIFDRLR